ncbi:MAG: flagellar biosynthetic protein FliQ [Myxococcota bacterium]|nr:flagellar biosynthetic protein FliQ [Myxococcota bacterium]
MNVETVIQIAAQGLMTVVYIVGPPLAAAMLTGLIVAIVQAATQIQETSITFVPKIVAVAVTLIYTSRWNINHLTSLFRELMQRFDGGIS